MSEPSMPDKQRFLTLSVDEAIRGARAGQGGPFGTVVVKDGVVIAKAANAVIANNDPTAHAEVQAIRAACATLASFQLDGCDVYASCEPCPMCLGALLWARPRAVYYAATRQDAAAAGFDDAVFYQTLGVGAGCSAGDVGAVSGPCPPLARTHVPSDRAGEPFAVYATMPSKIRY